MKTAKNAPAASAARSQEPRGPVTMHDVAALAGVSRATVSKYFNDGEGLKPDTRARILQACRELEYVPDPHAVSLVRGRSRIVGVVLPVINEPFFAEALRAIEQKAKALGMDVIIQCSYNDPAEEAAALMTMRSMKVAGVVLTAVASRHNVDLLRRLEQEMRIVYLDSYVHEECDYVMNDNRQSMAMLTRYLLGRGHRPAYLGAPPVAHPSPAERLAGYLEAMEEAGVPPLVLPGSTQATWDFEAYAFRHVLDWLSSGAWKRAGATALACGTDRLAIGAMSACRRFGLEPGKDLAIAGHDDLPISAYLHPPLTTFRQDVAAIGVAAMECLQARLDGTDAAPYRKRFSGGIVPRESA
ncbi:LacI family DNA-binding transcriptional regulator [Pseudoduganella umbonata]|uniref:DNA-binding LacI/PurR family transcriptional regulator n=1 Tax=Pseudoduganella umbonata TaxID=864828 RepID=A0A4P8HPK1_9BURK|nr:LacI family DNA-binding transcriptional regulator [Pseudoduganella umbonata]MBB3221249.1 DNA-binding LacI/PurR family transcriptional regulator [Pseudoduganella umbonata]QCP10428.1 LacI family transcriptional regulator [Pseudoduganella umbonata]